ncbi:hypothetical protein MMC10_005173 [Thelotrema lepadinum]|nr:hypothetical protein [Thelotrema lepadinum]
MLPPQLPEPPQQPHVRHFTGESRKRRGMTGREAAEAAERAVAQQRRAAQREHDLLEAEKMSAATERAESTAAGAAAKRARASASLKDLLVKDTEDLPINDNIEMPPPSSRRSGRTTHKNTKLLSQDEQDQMAAVARSKSRSKRPVIHKERIKQVSQFEDLLN